MKPPNGRKGVEMAAESPELRHANGNHNRQKGKTRLLSLDDLDQRTGAYKRTAELIERVAADLGGTDRLSTAEQQLVRHAAITGAMIEDMATRWLSGQPVDPAMFCTLSNSERRLYETVGLKRQPRDVTPNLREYVAAAYGKAE